MNIFEKLAHYLRLLILLLCFLAPFSGCVTNTPTIPTSIITNGYLNAEQLYDVMTQAGLEGVCAKTGFFVADSFYKLPTKDWVQYEFADILARKFFNKTYCTNSGDCDSAVLLSHATAVEMFWDDGSAEIAIGEIGYIREETHHGHAVLFFIYMEDKPHVGFLDPQTLEIFDLTEFERANIIYWSI